MPKSPNPIRKNVIGSGVLVPIADNEPACPTIVCPLLAAATTCAIVAPGTCELYVNVNGVKPVVAGFDPVTYPIPIVVNPTRTVVGLCCVNVKSSIKQVPVGFDTGEHAGVGGVVGIGGTKIWLTSNVKPEANVMNAVPLL